MRKPLRTYKNDKHYGHLIYCRNTNPARKNRAPVKLVNKNSDRYSAISSLKYHSRHDETKENKYGTQGAALAGIAVPVCLLRVRSTFSTAPATAKNHAEKGHKDCQSYADTRADDHATFICHPLKPTKTDQNLIMKKQNKHRQITGQAAFYYRNCFPTCLT
jgi:hypothetical protein